MAKEEHLKILKQGPRAWNEIRRFGQRILGDWGDGLEFSAKGDFEEIYNFFGADLREAKLQSADLTGVILDQANLSKARLSKAKLDGADLVKANLSDVEMVGAQLYGANLGHAIIKGADLSHSTLKSANFFAAQLDGARLHGALLGNTLFYDVDLSTTKGLDECIHEGPSCIDQRTLAKSKSVPIEFWRGCGLFDWQIEAAKLLRPGLTQGDVYDIGYEIIRLRAEQPIQLFSPFISYSSQDEGFARQLYNQLQVSGVRCWFAPEDMKIGDRIRIRIDEVIHLHDKLLLVLSEDSIASHWVEKEVETAFEKERETGEVVLFPIKLDDSVDKVKAGWAADIRRTRHIGDFTHWENRRAFSASFNRVLRDLRAQS